MACNNKTGWKLWTVLALLLTVNLAAALELVVKDAVVSGIDVAASPEPVNQAVLRQESAPIVAAVPLANVSFGRTSNMPSVKVTTAIGANAAVTDATEEYRKALDMEHAKVDGQAATRLLALRKSDPAKFQVVAAAARETDERNRQAIAQELAGMDRNFVAKLAQKAKQVKQQLNEYASAAGKVSNVQKVKVAKPEIAALFNGSISRQQLLAQVWLRVAG